MLPLGANGSGKSKLMTAAEIRSAASVYSQAQADAAFVALAGSYTNPSWIVSIPNTKVTGLGTLATQSGTFSGTSSGTNTGDQDLSSYLTSATATSTYLPLAGGTLTGDLKFTDATYDIGKSGATRPRDGFFSRYLNAGSDITSQTGTYYGLANYNVYIGNNLVQYRLNTGSIYMSFNHAGYMTLEYRTALAWAPVGQANQTPDLLIIRDAAGILAQRNGTNAQTFRLYNTYTSATSLETFSIKSVAGAAYQIGSAIGSAGGTNRDLSFGSWDTAGTFTAALTVDTVGKVGIGTSSPGKPFDLAKSGADASTNHAAFRTRTTGTSAYGPAFYIDGSSITGGRSWSMFTAGNLDMLTTGSFYFYDATAGASRFVIDSSGNIGIGTVIPTSLLHVVQSVSTTGSPIAFTLTGAAHTTLTLSTEATDVNFNLARTVQFATGALTTQRAVRIQAPTYSFVGASTITTASTLSISGPPVASTNATITTAYALNVESGNAYFAGNIRVAGGTTSTVGVAASSEILFGATAYITQSRSGDAYGTQHLGGTYQGSYLIRDDIAGAGFGWGATSSTTVTTPSLMIVRDANDTLHQRRGTNAQTLRVAGTWTSTTAYETLNIKGKASANFEIGPENGSAGGTLRGLTIGCYPAGTATIVGWAQFRPNASTGALEAFYLGPIADSTAVGGNARGTGAVDLQMTRLTAAQVASGQYSICIGYRNTASAYGTIAIGDGNTSTAQQCGVAIGYESSATGVYSSVAIGYRITCRGEEGCVALGQNTQSSPSQTYGCYGSFAVGSFSIADKSWTVATGSYSKADRVGQIAHAAGYFAASGDAQSARFVLRKKTTDATPTTLMLDGSTTRLTIPSGKIMFCDILISGIKSDGSASACYKRKVAIKNVAGTTALVGTVEAIGTDIEDNVLTDVAITADNTNDALDISVTGIAAETWRWVAVVEGLEIAYGV